MTTTDAQTEARAIAQTSLWVPAKPEHAKIGWTYDFEQTEHISRAAYDSTGYDATMEVVEFVMAEADRRYATALATERAAHAETKRERDELSDYSFEATKAITGLTVGGSEFFGRKLCDGRYSADLPYCVTHIQDRERRQHETILREGQKRHAATTRLAEVEKALEPFAAAASLIQSQAARIAELEAENEHFKEIGSLAVKFQFSDDIFVESRGPGVWVVTNGSSVLNNLGEWEYEPRPSSRTDEFIDRTRLAFSDAVRAARSLLNKDASHD